MSHVGYWYITMHFIFFQPPYLHKMVCFLNSWKQIVKPLCGKMLDWLNFRLGKIIGLIYALEKIYYQTKTQLRYNFGSVYIYMDRVKRSWDLSPMRAAKVQASLHIREVSPEPPLLAHTSSESRGTFRQKARSQAPLNGRAIAVKICHGGMLEDTNSLDGAYMMKV